MTLNSPVGGKGAVGREVEIGGLRESQRWEVGPNRAKPGAFKAVQAQAGGGQVGPKVGAKPIIIERFI